MENWRTAVVGGWKLIERASGEVALYDLATDPGEQHDVAQENPIATRYARGLLGLELERTRNARTSTERARARAATDHRAQETRIDPRTEAQLRALGYVH